MREGERSGGGVSEHHLMDYLLKCDVAPGCSLLWHQSNLGERQTWLLHRAQNPKCVWEGEGGEEVNTLTHQSDLLNNMYCLPCHPQRCAATFKVLLGQQAVNLSADLRSDYLIKAATLHSHAGELK